MTHGELIDFLKEDLEEFEDVSVHQQTHALDDEVDPEVGLANFISFINSRMQERIG